MDERLCPVCGDPVGPEETTCPWCGAPVPLNGEMPGKAPERPVVTRTDVPGISTPPEEKGPSEGRKRRKWPYAILAAVVVLAAAGGILLWKLQPWRSPGPFQALSDLQAVYLTGSGRTVASSTGTVAVNAYGYPDPAGAGRVLNLIVDRNKATEIPGDRNYLAWSMDGSGSRFTLMSFDVSSSYRADRGWTKYPWLFYDQGRLTQEDWVAGGVSDDGRILYYARMDGEKAVKLLREDLETGEETVIASGNLSPGSMSVDGTAIGYYELDIAGDDPLAPGYASWLWTQRDGSREVDGSVICLGGEDGFMVLSDFAGRWAEGVLFVVPVRGGEEAPIEVGTYFFSDWSVTEIISLVRDRWVFLDQEGLHDLDLPKGAVSLYAVVPERCGKGLDRLRDWVYVCRLTDGNDVVVYIDQDLGVHTLAEDGEMVNWAVMDPDGERLAYVSKGVLWLVEKPRTERRTVRSLGEIGRGELHAAPDLRAFWARSGRKLYYYPGSGGAEEIDDQCSGVITTKDGCWYLKEDDRLWYVTPGGVPADTGINCAAMGPLGSREGYALDMDEAGNLTVWRLEPGGRTVELPVETAVLNDGEK